MYDDEKINFVEEINNNSKFNFVHAWSFHKFHLINDYHYNSLDFHLLPSI